MRTFNTLIGTLVTRLFNPAPGAVYIPNDLRDKLNETNGLWQLQVKPMDTQLFASCLAAFDNPIIAIDRSIPDAHTDEYNAYRRQLGIVFNPMWQIQAYLNERDTGWKGDMYALVQRQKEISMAKTV